MGKKKMMMPANGHRIQGMTSEKFLDANEFLDELNLTGSENFMDAGCGDGHVAIKALEEYITDGCVYALDMYEPSIEDMLKYKQENNADNLIPIVSNIAEHIDLDDETLDVILMVNVFHGFKATRTLDEAVDELARVIKTDGGRIAIMDYKNRMLKMDLQQLLGVLQKICRNYSQHMVLK